MQGPYGLLLARSNDFTPFSIIIKGRYQTVFAQSFLILFMDQLWDRYNSEERGAGRGFRKERGGGGKGTGQQP